MINEKTRYTAKVNQKTRPIDVGKADGARFLSTGNKIDSTAFEVKCSDYFFPMCL